MCEYASWAGRKLDAWADSVSEFREDLSDIGNSHAMKKAKRRLGIKGLFGKSGKSGKPDTSVPVSQASTVALVDEEPPEPLESRLWELNPNSAFAASAAPSEITPHSPLGAGPPLDQAPSTTNAGLYTAATTNALPRRNSNTSIKSESDKSEEWHDSTR
jgi:hypothetical protein